MDENPFIHGPMGWLLCVYLAVTLGGALLLVLYSYLYSYFDKSPWWQRVKDNSRWGRRRKSAWPA